MNDMKTIFDCTMKSLKGKDVSFKDYEGKVLLIVNTASKCGFTPQYAGLEKLYEQYKDKGLVVLGFPCNQFLAQEPGDAKEIQESCLVNYGVSFPMFAKIDVNGDKAPELYKFLKDKAPFMGYPDKELGAKLDSIHKEHSPEFLNGNEIRWNFTKFLVSRDGETIKRFESMVTPESIAKDIENLL